MRRVRGGLAALVLSAGAAAAQIVLTPEAQPLPPPLPPPGAPAPLAEPAPAAEPPVVRSTAPAPDTVPVPRPRPDAPAAVAVTEGSAVIDDSASIDPGSTLSPESLPTLPAPDIPSLPSLPPGEQASALPPLPPAEPAPELTGEAVAGPMDSMAEPLAEVMVLDSPFPAPSAATGGEEAVGDAVALPELAPPPPAPGGPDLAYGAFQRGFYHTAFDIAIKRAEAGDVPAQTLFGIIYEGGYGVPQDFA
jgi:hypothetical protein